MRLRRLVWLVLTGLAVTGAALAYVSDVYLSAHGQSEIGQSTLMPMKSGFRSSQVSNTEGEASVWQRETLYYGFARYQRVGEGPDLRDQPPLSKTGERRFRILLVGDSFMWGYGITDPQATWSGHLRRILDDEAPGQYEVVTLSRIGASLMEEVEWLNERRLEEIDPDLIVLGYVSNDMVASGREAAVCGTTPGAEVLCDTKLVQNQSMYRTCVSGESGVAGRLVRNAIIPAFPNLGREMLRRLCDPARLGAQMQQRTDQQIWNNPKLSPHWSLFEGAAGELFRISETFPVAILPATEIHPDVAAVFARNNLQLLSAANARQLRRKSWNEADATGYAKDVSVTPTDGHPGSRMTYALARDTAAAVRHARGLQESAGVPVPQSVESKVFVESTLPYRTELRANGTEVTVSYTGYREGDGYAADTPGSRLPVQAAPCALLSRPYAQVLLSRKIAEAKHLTLRRLHGPSNFDVYSYGYTSDGTTTVRRIATLSSSHDVMVSPYPGARGFLLAPLDQQGCALDAAITLPAFSVLVQVS